MSSDGSTVAWVEQREHGNQIVVNGEDRFEPRPTIGNLSLSPDGSQVFFHSSQDDRTLVHLNTDQRDATELYPRNETPTALKISPDGTRWVATKERTELYSSHSWYGDEWKHLADPKMDRAGNWACAAQGHDDQWYVVANDVLHGPYPHLFDNVAVSDGIWVASGLDAETREPFRLMGFCPQPKETPSE